PRRLRLVVHGPAVARGFGHGADIEATQRRAVAHVGVPRRGRIGRERECLIVHRGEAARKRAAVAYARTGRARREVHQPVAAVAVHQHGARAIAIRQRDLVAALGVVVTPVGAGGGEGGGGEPVNRYTRRGVEVRFTGREPRHVQQVVQLGERRLRGCRLRQQRGVGLGGAGGLDHDPRRAGPAFTRRGDRGP